ncbi:glycerophosphodiester phosphodiesterase family protein [Rhabdobacter roseus]|uniref:Glycerophosphoryl diester phosphodiesterase n=1 Tax=Rhabdobacter roseus TaxID=1655419 RepID=A0A840U129_9BACT|nr:glycerophosphodiester phosphodiesterase family protein [Rhabdobacter roseus]MBB5285830.1 glycerophosphoryl diester phosphodiesterase [Rhabdobacter roseus]
MFRRFLYLTAICLALAACTPRAPRTFLRSHTLPKYLRYEPSRPPLISAHRGGGSYAGYPENCLESFAFLARHFSHRKGLPWGILHRKVPLVVECDISLTKDGVLLMMHDDTYERTTTGSGAVAEQSWAYGQSLYLKDHRGHITRYKVPSLADVLKWGRGRVLYTLDVKRNVPYHRVVEAVQEAKAQPYAAIITYNVAQAALVHRLDPDLMISVTIRNEEEYQRLREAGVPDHRMVAFVGVREPSADLYEFLHKRGIMTILGTLGNLDKMAEARGDATYRKFVENGADVLSTDRPLEAGRALGLVK